MILVLKLSILTILLTNTNAHWHTAYSQASDLGGGNEDWMAQLCDASKITEISIPGTHDTMADDNDGWAVDTQSMDLPEQLAVGIRYLDIRCKISCDDACFGIFHGPYYLDVNFGDVLNDVKSFLDAHPTEFVIMQIQNEDDDETQAEKATFVNIVEQYVTNPTLASYFYTSNTIPTVGEVRKKIVIIRNFWGSNSKYISWYDSSIWSVQNDWTFSTNWDLYDKWTKVKSQLNAANNNKNAEKFYINFLSASGGSFPYFVASGHTDPSASASRLSTGFTTPGWASKYPDFPRVSCFIGICTIAFEGTNILAYDYMNSLNFVGIIMIDFPGKGLIDRVIGKNSDELQNHANCPIADKTLYCNSEPVPGYLRSGQTQTFKFTNDKVQTITFTDCDSDFDPQLRLYQSGATTMMNTDSDCDGDDCKDDTKYICPTALRETFTINNLPVGEYELKLNAYGAGSGNFKVQAFCNLQGTIDTTDTKTGIIGNFPETVYYSLKIDQLTPTITFTDCQTSFDPTLFLLNLNFETISDAACDYDHDDCGSTNIHYECATLNRETFTIEHLAPGRYFLGLTPYNTGGNYQIDVGIIESFIVDIALVKDGASCYSQIKNLGNIATPQQCAVVAARDPQCSTGNQFMFSYSYASSWGCRCCPTSYQYGGANANWDVYRYAEYLDTVLVKDGANCYSQLKNLGNIATPQQCAVIAATDPACSGNQFMFSDSYASSWGCRCCAASTTYGNANSNWDVYEYSNVVVVNSAEAETDINLLNDIINDNHEQNGEESFMKRFIYPDYTYFIPIIGITLIINLCVIFMVYHFCIKPKFKNHSYDLVDQAKDIQVVH